MAVTSGFYQSLNGDRKYSSDQFGAIFDGVIRDGIFQSYGQAFAVTAPSNGMSVNVGSGRCWFKGHWILNDGMYTAGIMSANVANPRVDSVVFHFDLTGERTGDIRVLTGTPATSPQAPTPKSTKDVYEIVIATIRVKANATSITPADITNYRGTQACPWVTGPLEILDATSFYNQWGAQFSEWADKFKSDSESSISSEISSQKAQFSAWRESMTSALSGDQAQSLAARIVALETLFNPMRSDIVLSDGLLDASGQAIYDSKNSQVTGKIVYEQV